jgi:hypothetical protein
MNRSCNTQGKEVNNILSGRPRHKWENNIKKDHKEMSEGSDWINLTHDRTCSKLLWSR